MLAASRDMLAMAKEKNWDVLVEQEVSRRNAIAILQKHIGSTGNGLPPGIRTQANTLIQEIGRLDGETMALAEGRMADIGQLFHSAEVSKRLSKAYRSL